MTYKKTIGNFLEQLEFDADFYDIHSEQELLEQAKYFLDEYDIEIKKDCDYRNDQNENGWYYCDVASERADSQVDIYNHDLWEKAKDFQYFIEDVLNEF